MPLSAAAPREHIHTRHVDCRGYRRQDGLWDIEGHIVDTKTYAFKNRWRGEVKSGVPVHEMWIRLTIDDDLLIRAVEATSDHGPYPICADIVPNFQRLVGHRIAPGFTRKTRELLGGVNGCTHLVELLGPVATTAFQTVFPLRERERKAKGEAEAPAKRASRPRLIDTCHALASTSEVVKTYWPEFYTGKN